MNNSPKQILQKVSQIEQIISKKAVIISLLCFVLLYILIIIPIYLFYDHILLFTIAPFIAIVPGCLSILLFLKTNPNHFNNHFIDLNNRVLTAALNKKNSYHLILNSDNSTFYANENFLQRFSNHKEHYSDLDALLESDLISHKHKEEILYALEKGHYEFIKFHLNTNSKEHSLTLTLEPFIIEKDEIKGQHQAGQQNIYHLIHIFNPLSTDSPFDDIMRDQELMVYAINEDGSFCYFNPSFAKLLDYPPEELLEINFFDLLIEHNTCENFDIPVTKRLLYNKHRGIVSFLELGIDVGGKEVDFLHYKLAVPLREQFEETNFRQLLDYSPIPEVILDNSGAINKGNKAFWSLTNKDEDQLWHFLDMVQAESKEEVSNLLKVIFDEGKSKTLNHPIEVKLQNGKDGLTVLLYVNRIVSGKDLTAKLICSFIDITEHKKLEMHLAQSQKMQAVGQLAGGIAHDFNNLLTAMIGFCDLLLMRHPAGDQSFADIMQIKQNANRAANLVRQLLAFSRKQVLIPQIMDITGILAESSNLVRRLIGENIELIMNHGRDLRLVKVDQVQLEQVIINLAVNARDAMKNGGTLTIRTSNIDIDEHHPLSPKLISPVEEEEQIKPGEYVLLEVSDSGCGMSKDLVSKIFEPFFSTKEIGAGTGLGLSTVFGVVKQTEGYIYVTTEEGAGTTFSIFLKGYDNKELVSTTAHDQSDKISYTDLTGHGTILMVEDEAPVRIFAAHALTHKGYKVLEAEDGETALRIIAEKGASIDLIISDVIMPGMNGPAMIEKIYQQYPSIKVIFISGYAEDAFSETEGWDNKFNFLGKPFTLTQLASKVKEVMAKD